MPLIPFDQDIAGGWGPIKIYIPEFEDCFAYHDRGYDMLIDGTSEITLKELDRRFLANMLRRAAGAAWLAKDLSLGVKLTRYAWECFAIARAWAKTVRRSLEAYRPV